MKRKNIAVLMTALDTEGQAEILKGIEVCGKAHGCNVAVFVWFTGAYEEERHNLGEINITRLPDLNLFDGVILFADALHITSNRERLEKLLEKVTCPVVTIGCKYKNAPAVWADSYGGMHGLMEYLVQERGMTRLHFVKGVEGNVDAEARFKAYTDVLGENGILIEKERITQGDFYVLGGEKAAKDVLHSELPFPEVIVCANDTMAITVYDILTKKGYRVPEDVLITGYDYSLECRVHYPSIISVKIQERKLGEKACDTLLKLMEGTAVEEDCQVKDKVVLDEVTDGNALLEISDILAEKNSVLSDTGRRVMIHHIITLEKNIMTNTGYESWKNAVKFFVAQMEPKEFYCCVNRGFVNDVFEAATVAQESMSVEECLAYSEKMDVSVAYKNGAFFEKASFVTKYALDDLFAESDSGKLYVFSPMHYLDRNFGYFVFVDSVFPIGNPLYISWLNFMNNSIENIRKQTMLVNAMVELDDMYIRDSLTGVYNRFGMERYFEIIKEKCIDRQTFFMLSFADVDGLKKINDVYGHEDGDRIIRAVGQILQEQAGEEAYVVRYGGDEFIVLGTAFSEKEAESYWTRVYKAIESYNAEHEGQAELSVSVGYNLVRLDPYSYLEDCIKEADEKMYAEKKRKKAMRKGE